MALKRLLEGDVIGVREAFLETVRHLRAREFTASDIAIRARLTKSPEKYLASRAKLREAVYEALLDADRTWQAGEKIRFYRATGGRSVLLQDEDSLEPQRDYDVALYLDLLVNTYAARLKKAFSPQDFERLFRPEDQDGLFDAPISNIQPLRI